MGESDVILNTPASVRVLTAHLLQLQRRWRLHDRAVRALHVLLILSLLMSSLAAALPTSAAALDSLDVSQSTGDWENSYMPPSYSRPEPRLAEIFWERYGRGQNAVGFSPAL